MLELGRKEHHLLSAISVVILIVAVMVFAYTQAIRQLKHRKELRDRLEEQLTMGREQLARHTRRPDVAALQAEVAKLKSALLSPGMLQEAARRLGELAEKEYGVRGIQVKVGDRPAQTLSVPLDGRLDFEAHLYALELTGAATSRNAVALAAAMGDTGSGWLAPLVGMEMAPPGPGDTQPVRVSLRWLVAVLPGGTREELPGPLKAPEKPEWGWRQELFQSPLEQSGALKIPAGELARFRLSGIVWDETAPTCVINGTAFRPGDDVGAGYRVVLITPQVVLLENRGKELLLRL